MPSDTESVIRRILVAFDESAQSVAALEAAARLAAQLQAELLGMFVEDIDLMSLSDLPFVHEVGISSAVRRELSRESMTRALRVRAGRLRMTLESVAQKHRLSVSFRITRGKVLSEVLAASREVDLVAVGTSGFRVGLRQRAGSTYQGIVRESQCSVLLLQENVVPGNSVMVLFDGSPSAQQALRVGRQMAAATDDPLVIICLGGNDLFERADTVLESSDIARQYRQLDKSRLHQLDEILRKDECGVLLIPRGMVSEPGLGSEDLARLRCPALILS